MPSENRETTPLNRLFQFYIYWPQYVIILGLILIIAFLFPQGKTLKYSYQLNDIAREPIIAPFTFSILKTQDRLNSDLDEQLKSVPFVFNRQDNIVTDHSQKISEFSRIFTKQRSFAKRRFLNSGGGGRGENPYLKRKILRTLWDL